MKDYPLIYKHDSGNIYAFRTLGKKAFEREDGKYFTKNEVNQKYVCIEDKVNGMEFSTTINGFTIRSRVKK